MTIRAHVEAWHIYDKEFRDEQRGKVNFKQGSIYSPSKLFLECNEHVVLV